MEKFKFTKELLECYGWKEIESKNPIMYSYKQENTNVRLNYYFTTGTVTQQTPAGKYKRWNGVHSDNEIEDILCKI